MIIYCEFCDREITEGPDHEDDYYCTHCREWIPGKVAWKHSRFYHDHPDVSPIPKSYGAANIFGIIVLAAVSFVVYKMGYAPAMLSGKGLVFTLSFFGIAILGMVAETTHHAGHTINPTAVKIAVGVMTIVMIGAMFYAIGTASY